MTQTYDAIVIGRDHLDSGSVASPNRETEAMEDGSDAISDWAILNPLINAVGSVGMGAVRHADAGYETAIEAAKRHGLNMPMLGKSS